MQHHINDKHGIEVIKQMLNAIQCSMDSMLYNVALQYSRDLTPIGQLSTIWQ